MRRVVIFLLTLITASCASQTANPSAEHAPTREMGSPRATAVAETESPAPTRLLSTSPPTSLPTETLAPRSPTPAPRLEHLGPFEGVLGNIAQGKQAPGFTARAMGDQTVSLTGLRGRYVLLVPTVVGCGDCVFTMTELAQAYRPYSDGPMEVVILNLFPKDVPESWNGFAETYPEMDVIWAVVNNDRFPIDYDLKTLGTTFLINPDGFIVYRRDHPLWADEFTQLFELDSSQADIFRQGNE